MTCTIIGLRNFSAYKDEPKYLFNYEEKKLVDNINPYLANGTNTFVTKQNVPISDFPPIAFGSMPNDGGMLLLNEQEKVNLISEDKRGTQLIHQILGSQEFIRGEKRFCLWITDDLLPLALSINSVRKRIENCQKKEKKVQEIARPY